MLDRLKRYKCVYCKDFYKMTVEDKSRRSMTAAKGSCEKNICMLEAAKKYIEKSRKSQRVVKKARDKEARDKIKTLSEWKNDLQGIVNWIVKELDKSYDCISHPGTKGFLRYDAGHGFSVKAHSDIRFNLHNIHKQNSNSNMRTGGDSSYVKGLMERYGREYVEMYLDLPLKWKGTGKEKFKIKNIKEEYLPGARDIQREMKKGKSFTRDQVNEIIGIYTKN